MITLCWLMSLALIGMGNMGKEGENQKRKFTFCAKSQGKIAFLRVLLAVKILQKP